MEKILQQILEKLGELGRGQEELRSEVAALQRGQEELRSEVAALQRGQEELRSEVAALQRGQEAQNQRLERLEKGQEELRSAVAALQEAQLRVEFRIENEVIEKIRGLFDARQVHLDYFESLRDAVARIEENIDYLIRREQRQDLRLDEHEREIRLLRLRK